MTRWARALLTRRIPWQFAFVAIVGLPSLVLVPAGWAAIESSDSLADLSLEQLSRIQVTSVSRRRQPLADAASSIYVITADDIRRSGATSIPEALRLAPNLQVARADAEQYAVTARGFETVLANKMLVLIDGRTVYSPLFSGVFWEAQDVMLEDVERIEVISGPGGTLWGSNAVNGVINIITRQPAVTQGVLAGGVAGPDARSAEARYGGGLGGGVFYRVYGKSSEVDATTRANGSVVRDGSNHSQGGFRARWLRGAQGVTVQGDLYRYSIDQVPGIRRLTGGNALARWFYTFADSSNMSLQTYFDRTVRDQPGAVRDELNTFDVEFLHNVNAVGRHHPLYGAGFRWQPDHTDNLTPGLALIPADRELNRANVFVQDQITLHRRLDLIAGVKYEYNVFTHWEGMPNVRLAWKPTAQQFVWAAVSRAVRAPSRVDREFFVPAAPPHFLLDGGPDFHSEIADVAELGLRGQPWPTLSYSVTGFVDHYRRLRSIVPTLDGPQFANGLESDGRGAESWVVWRVLRPWRVSAGLYERRATVKRSPGQTDLGGAASLGDDPNFTWTLRSSADLPASVECDVMLRRVGSLPGAPVPSYTAVDSRLGCRLPHGLDASVTGQNLFAPHHTEWGAPGSRAILDATVLFEVAWRP